MNDETIRAVDEAAQSAMSDANNEDGYQKVLDATNELRRAAGPISSRVEVAHDTPATGLAAASLLSDANEKLAGDIRGLVNTLKSQVAEIERMGEIIIEETGRNSRELQRTVSTFTRQTKEVQRIMAAANDTLAIERIMTG